MFLPLLSLYGYTSNCNIKLNITEYPSERLLLQRGRRSLFCLSAKNFKNQWEDSKKIRQRESERRNLQSRRKIIGNTPSNATPFLRVNEGRFEVIQFTLPKPQIVLVDL